MATAFAHDILNTTPPLARAAGKLALVASAGAEAIAAGLNKPPLTFAEARDKVRFLLEAETHLSDDTTDEEVDAASDLTVAAFKAFFAMPARTAAEAFDKIAVTRELWEAHETPHLANAMQELRALTCGPSGPVTAGNEAILGAWERWKATSLAVEASGRDDDDPSVVALYAERDQAERVILASPVATIAGLVVKQRFALEVTTPDAWVLQALYHGDDATLFARKAELDLEARLIVDTIQGLLAGPSAPPAPDRSAWDAAFAAYRAADAEREAHWQNVECPLGAGGKTVPANVRAESDRLGEASVQAENRLFEVHSPDMAALSVKLRLLFANHRDPIPDFNALVEADARRLAGATVAPVSLSPVRQAFETWIAARITYDLADSVLEPKEDPAYLGWIKAERTLAATPPQSAEDMLYKLFPLALSEHGPNAHQGTFEVVYQPAGPIDAPYLDDSTWRGLIDGMLALSPRLAEVVAMPAVRIPEIKPDMWLPDAIPIDQMEQWLGHLTADAEAYAKLWLRMVDASKMAAVVRIEEGGTEVLCLGGSMDDCTAEHMAIDRALRSHLRSSGHRGTVIGQLKAKGRCYDYRQAVAA